MIRSRGGHRDNPNSVKFRADYRAVAIDSLFVKSQNTNCIEDIDSFLLKLGNFASSTPSPPVPLPDTNTALPLVSQDLAAVSNMPPNVTPQEGNIIVYLAGYVGRKAVLKFKCKDCRALWKKHDESSHSDLYTFINNKQYDDLTVWGGGLHVMSKVKDASSISSVTCSNIVCTSAQSYMVQLYFIVRIHHLLREQNRQIQRPNAKRNRKTMKLMHL